ncbi:hypothetical protein C4J92_1880 [Pseudomonas sp. R3-18-08]|nr:hypothetical protein C4J92_1880 [Pseudomonas sp. R3-18-08]
MMLEPFASIYHEESIHWCDHGCLRLLEQVMAYEFDII